MKVIIVCVLLAAACAALNEELPSDDARGLAACDFSRCFRTCMSNGWRGGYCQGNNCVCQGKFMRAAAPHSIEVLPDETDSRSARAGCEAKDCILYCQRMGKNGGKCIGGRCLCF